MFLRHISIFACCWLAAWAGSFPTVAADDPRPLKVFLLVGQSNMQGHAHLRTLEHLAMDPESAPLLDAIVDDQGEPRVWQDVWVSYLSSDGVKRGRLTTGFGADADKFGPELTFGAFLHRSLGEPLLLIKTAWGGRSLHTDFRPPSAGPYRFTAQQREQLEKQGRDLTAAQAEKDSATGESYRLMIEHVREVLADIRQVYPDYDPDRGYELAGLVWFQGWNDMIDSGVYPERGQPGGYDRYSEWLAAFIRDVRRDLEVPHLPVVIGVFGVGGPVDQYPADQRRYAAIHQGFRLAMAAPADLPEFRGNVAAVFTEHFWDQELSDLRARESVIRRQLQVLQAEEKLSPEQTRAAEAKLRGEAFTDRESTVLQRGVSNLEFHYLGSAKIMARIGKGFAEAMESLPRGD